MPKPVLLYPSCEIYDLISSWISKLESQGESLSTIWRGDIGDINDQIRECIKSHNDHLNTKF